MKRQLTQGILIASLAIAAWSCNQSDPAPKGNYVDGVFVTTFGNFLDNNGSLSFFKRENNTADADVYSTVNGAALKGGIQGYAYSGSNGIILVDNSSAGLDKAEIVNANTLEKIASIGAPDIENPRKVVFANDSKAYVACWGTTGQYPNFFINKGYVAVVDLGTNKVTKKIPVGKGVENITYKNGKVYAGTVSYSGVNTLSVISATTDEVVKEVTFTDAPNPIGFDANGKPWVQNGLEVVRLNPDSYEKEATLKITATAGSSVGSFSFTPDLKTVYFISSRYQGSKLVGETCKFAITDTQISTATPVIKRVFNGLGVDPKQGLIYGAVDPSPVQSGYAVRYRADGTLIDSIKVGASPTGFVFKQ